MMYGTNLFIYWILARSMRVTMCALKGLWFRKRICVKDMVINPRNKERTPRIELVSIWEKQDTGR